MIPASASPPRKSWENPLWKSRGPEERKVFRDLTRRSKDNVLINFQSSFSPGGPGFRQGRGLAAPIGTRARKIKFPLFISRRDFQSFFGRRKSSLFPVPARKIPGILSYSNEVVSERALDFSQLSRFSGAFSAGKRVMNGTFESGAPPLSLLPHPGLMADGFRGRRQRREKFPRKLRRICLPKLKISAVSDSSFFDIY